VEITLRNGKTISDKADARGRFAVNGVPKGPCAVSLPGHRDIDVSPKVLVPT
jgi:hypothetical protein